jgi:hypothetical protein
MPRSFLIKRVEKVKTGYFPWNKEMLVQSCCLEYEVKNQEDDIDQGDDHIEIIQGMY